LVHESACGTQADVPCKSVFDCRLNRSFLGSRLLTQLGLRPLMYLVGILGGGAPTMAVAAGGAFRRQNFLPLPFGRF
jgi:hypothetical protein